MLLGIRPPKFGQRPQFSKYWQTVELVVTIPESQKKHGLTNVKGSDITKVGRLQQMYEAFAVE
jgi:hypothetical protein